MQKVKCTFICYVNPTKSILLQKSSDTLIRFFEGEVRVKMLKG